MPDLNFEVVGAEPERSAAVPVLAFKLRVRELTGHAVHSVLLRCQIRIEPARRRYSEQEQADLADLFGTPDRWGKTLRPFLWTQVSTVLRPFEDGIEADLSVPCSYDFTQAATQYFDALESGELPLCFLFSGTIFYQGDEGSLQIAQIAWEKEAAYRLPAATWKTLMDRHYPNVAWLHLRKDVFDRLREYKSRSGLASWEQALEKLLEKP